MSKFMTVTKVVSAGLLLFAINLPAQAYYCCKTNPAICKGICGQRCCGANLSAGVKSGGMNAIPADQLKKEADECREAGPVIKAIDEELRTRGAGGAHGAAPSPTRDPAGAPMPQ